MTDFLSPPPPLQERGHLVAPTARPALPGAPPAVSASRPAAPERVKRSLFAPGGV